MNEEDICPLVNRKKVTSKRTPSLKIMMKTTMKCLMKIQIMQLVKSTLEMKMKINLLTLMIFSLLLTRSLTVNSNQCLRSLNNNTRSYHSHRSESLLLKKTLMKKMKKKVWTLSVILKESTTISPSNLVICGVWLIKSFIWRNLLLSVQERSNLYQRTL